MTLILEIPTETEHALTAEASERGLLLPDFVQELLRAEARRLAAIDEAMGALASLLGSSEDFIARKDDEIAQEKRRWQASPTPAR